METNERYYLIPYNSRAGVVHLLAQRDDTKSNVKWGGFRFKRPTYLATLKSCDTAKQSVCGLLCIYTMINKYEMHTISFQTFFWMGTFIDRTQMELYSLSK